MKELRSLQRLLKRFEIEGVTFVELGEDVLVEFDGNKALLRKSGVISVDTLREKYGAYRIFNLPAHQYLFLEWLYDKGLQNDKFKYTNPYPYCEVCRDHHGMEPGMPACAQILTIRKPKYVCPEHSVNQEVIKVLVGG